MGAYLVSSFGNTFISNTDEQYSHSKPRVFVILGLLIDPNSLSIKVFNWRNDNSRV